MSGKDKTITEIDIPCFVRTYGGDEYSTMTVKLVERGEEAISMEIHDENENLQLSFPAEGLKPLFDDAIKWMKNKTIKVSMRKKK